MPRAEEVVREEEGQATSAEYSVGVEYPVLRGEDRENRQAKSGSIMECREVPR